MHGSLFVVLWLVGATTVAGARDGEPCAHQPSTCAAIAEFTSGVQAYMHVRQNAARDLPSEWVFTDPEGMLIVRGVLRRAIRDARPDARAGDIFTARVAAAFRHIVAATARDQRVDPEDIVRELRADRGPDARTPMVNGPYDWRLGAWMWPALLQALPPLPPELQYRIVDNDLVLVDLRASLVVDILDDVMTVDEH